MAVQPIEVIDTAVKIGLGAIVGGIFTYLLERLKQRNERFKERLRLRQERIIDPIVSHIDELLVPLSEAYWSNIDQVVTNVEQKVIALRNKEAMIEARIAALGNEELSRRFSELTTKLIMVRSELADGKIVPARDELKRAFELAGNVLVLLFELDRLKGASGAPWDWLVRRYGGTPGRDKTGSRRAKTLGRGGA